MRQQTERALAGAARVSGLVRQVIARTNARVESATDPFLIVMIGGGSLMIMAGEIGRTLLTTRLGFASFPVGVAVGLPIAFAIMRWVEDKGWAYGLLAVSVATAAAAAAATSLPTTPR